MPGRTICRVNLHQPALVHPLVQHLRFPWLLLGPVAESHLFPLLALVPQYLMPHLKSLLLRLPREPVLLFPTWDLIFLPVHRVECLPLRFTTQI